MMQQVRYLARLFALLLLALLAAASLAEEQAEHPYVGSNGCKRCHIKEYRSWSETAMAKAFDKLRPGVAAEEKRSAGLDPDADYTADQSCLPCHVTGYGKPGGFVDFETTPELAGVGCEACHGPGGTYLEDGYMTFKNKSYKKADLVAVGLVGEIGAAQCEGCHNADSPFVGDDFVFDFATKRDEGTHEKFPLKYEH